jgi:hypothetical protein
VSAFYEAVQSADEALSAELAAIRDAEAADRITPAEAAAKRVELLERHLAALRRLRREHHLDGG